MDLWRRMMIGALLKFVVVVILLFAAGAFFLGYRWADRGEDVIDRPIATTGTGDVDTARARETGAEIGEKVAVGADRAQDALANAGLTAKIKAKLALDDTVEAFDVDVDTEDTTVTLSGRVDTERQRTRVLQLARETEGVTSVVDRLQVGTR